MAPAAGDAAINKLIYSVLHRLGDKLSTPAHTPRSSLALSISSMSLRSPAIAETPSAMRRSPHPDDASIESALASDPVMQQTVQSILALASSRINLIVTALVTMAENMTESASIADALVNASTETPSFGARLFLMRLVYACLVQHWRSTCCVLNGASDTSECGDRASSMNSGRDVICQPDADAEYQRPLPLDPGLAAMILNNALPLLGRSSTEDCCENFVSSLGLTASVTDLLNTVDPVVTAGRLVFFVSASNWNTVMAALNSSWTALGNATDMDLGVLNALPWCHLNRSKLQQLLTEIGSPPASKKNAQSLSCLLRIAIWNWIALNPRDFAALHNDGTNDFENVENVFAAWVPMADGPKRRPSVIRLQTALLLLSPSSVSAKHSESNSFGSKANFLLEYFLPTLRQMLRSSKHTDLALQCWIDICHAASMLSANCPMQLLIDQLEGDIQLFQHGIDISSRSIVDYFVAALRRKGYRFIDDNVTAFGQNGFQEHLLKALCRVCSDDRDDGGSLEISQAARPILANILAAKQSHSDDDGSGGAFESAIELIRLQPSILVQQGAFECSLLSDICTRLHDPSCHQAVAVALMAICDTDNDLFSELRCHIVNCAASILLSSASEVDATLTLRLLSSALQFPCAPENEAEALDTSKNTEAALLLCLSSNEIETFAVAVQALEAFLKNRQLARMSDDMDQLYGQFITEIKVTSGKALQQKRVRKLMRSFTGERQAIALAWTEHFNRWSTLTKALLNREEQPVDALTHRRSLLNLATRKRLRPAPSLNIGDAIMISSDIGPYWGNLTANLCALGGGQSNSLPASNELLQKFMKEMLNLLVCDNSYIREIVKDAFGNELSVTLLSTFFAHLTGIVEQLFGDAMDEANKVISDRASFHIEQAIAVMKLLLERGGIDRSMNFDSLMLAYARYLNYLGCHSTGLRIKIRMCHLIETLMRKQSRFGRQQDHKIRNKLLELVLEWTSDFAQNQCVSSHQKMHRDLDLACMKSMTALLEQLPLLSDHGDQSLLEIRSKLFGKYFSFFIEVLRRCRQSKELSGLKEQTILALSNLLSGNIDCGLRQALAVAYHEDTKTRTAFMRVLTNILNQGAEFDGLADNYRLDRLGKLIELVLSHEFIVLLAMADSCPVGDLDGFAGTVFTLSEHYGCTLALLETAIQHEVRQTATAATLFRRNSFTSRFMVLFAKSIGTAFIRDLFSALSPLLLSQFSQSSFEIDPTKGGDQDLAANTDNLNCLAREILNTILASTHRVPMLLRYMLSRLASSASVFSETAIGTVVGGFFFLRFVCPAFITPDQHGIKADAKLKRGLVLFTKILQNVSNGVLFGAKEPFMEPLNPLLREYLEPVKTFLIDLTALDVSLVDEVATKQPQLNRTEPIAVLNQLHRYVVQNFDRISEELSKDDASSLKPFISVSATPSKLFRPSHSSIGTDHTDTPSKALMLKDLLSVVSQLGPVAAASAKPNVEVSGNRAVEEYIARFQGSDIASLKAKEIFYEGGVSKARKSVFYFIGRRFIVGQIAPELLMATVLSMLQPFTKTPFDVVVDLSRFSEQNQFDGFWLEQFAAIFPDELWNQLGTVYLFNVNTAFKKFLKLISRHVSARLVKRVVAVNALNEFNEFISPVELRLPRSTETVSKEAPMFSSVVRVLSFRNQMPVTLKINQDYLLISSAKKKEIFSGVACVMQDIFSVADIDDVYVGSDKGAADEFIIKFKHGRFVITLNSLQRDEIISVIREQRAKAMAQIKMQPDTPNRMLQPNDVPGALLNMTLLNMGSDDADLRLSAYNMLCSLANMFKFSIAGQLLNANGMILPNNCTSFIVKISQQLAQSEPHLTMELTKECLVGFKKSNKEAKYLCLEYISCWLRNLDRVSLDETEFDQLVRALIDLTVHEKEMHYALQNQIWAVMAKTDGALERCVDTFVAFAVENGVGTFAAESVGETCVTFSAVNPRLVSGKIIARLRKAIFDSKDHPCRSLMDHASWREICILTRFCLVLSFNNRLCVEVFLPDIFYCITMAASVGPPLIKASVYGLLVNTVHSLCTSMEMTKSETQAYQRLLSEISQPKFQLLFGVSRVAADSYASGAHQVMSDVSCEQISLIALKTIADYMIQVIHECTSHPDLSFAWRARWMSLTTTQAFVENPALQPRAFLLLGRLATGKMDDELLSRIFATLKRSLLFFDDQEEELVGSVISCLTSIVEQTSVESHQLSLLFWIGMSMAAIDHAQIFSAALALIQTVLKALYNKGFFVQESLNRYLMRAREQHTGVFDMIDSACGVSFKSDFGFAVGTVLMKGLRHAVTKAATTATLVLFLDLSNKSPQGSIRAGGPQSPDSIIRSRIPSSILGFLAPLLPIMDFQALKELLRLIGARIVEEEAQEGQFGRTSRFIRIAESMNVNESPSTQLLIAGMMASLESSVYDSERLCVYRFFVDCICIVPALFDEWFDRLLPKMYDVLETSPSVQLVSAVHQLLSSIVARMSMQRSPDLTASQRSSLERPLVLTTTMLANGASLKRRASVSTTASSKAVPHTTASKHALAVKRSAEKMGFVSLSSPDCGRFDPAATKKRAVLAHLTGQLIDSVL